MSDINMDSPVEASVSSSTSTITLEDEWMVVPTTKKADGEHPSATNTGMVNDPPLDAKGELEIIQEVLESTRAAFRQEHETIQRTKSRLAEVTQELEATKEFFAKEVADSKLELAAVEKDFQDVNTRFEAAKDTSKKEMQDAKLELASDKKNLEDVKSQLEAANSVLNENQDKFKSQAAVAAALEEANGRLAKELEATRAQLATTRQELMAAKANLVAAKEAAMTAEGAITEELDASEVQLSSARQELTAAKSELLKTKQAATAAQVAIRKELGTSNQGLRATKDQFDATKKTFAIAKNEWKTKQEAAVKELERVKQGYEAVKRENESHKQMLKEARQELDALQHEKAGKTTARENLGSKIREQVEFAIFKHDQERKALADLKQKHQAHAKTRAEERKRKEDAAERAINLADKQAETASKQYIDMLYEWVKPEGAVEKAHARFLTLNDIYLAERKAFSDLKRSHEAMLRKEVEESKVLEAEAEKRVKVAAARVASARKELQEFMQNGGKGAAVEVQFADGRQARPYVGGAK